MLQKFNCSFLTRRGKLDCLQLVAFQRFSTVPPVTEGTVIKKVKEPSKRKGLVPEKFETMNIHDAVTKIKEVCWARFDETIEISCNMGLDPRKPNQSVKGIAKLPSGSGKKIRICVFAAGQDAKDALEAGADTVGGEELIAQIQGGDINYHTVIASPDMMAYVGKVGKILGPRGLMPNPKLGTVTRDVVGAVKAAKAGSVKYKVEKRGIIQAGLGKKSFSDDALLDNIRSFMISLQDNKPEGLKGKYLKRVTLTSTMGPGIPVDLHSVDPSSARFMLKLAQMGK